MGYLIERKRKSTTIKSYISAIKSVLADDGIELNEDRFLLTSLTKACRLVNDHVRTRLPIQKGMLNILVNTCQKLFAGQPYLTALHVALLTSGYFGLLRVGELTGGEHPIKACDVHVGKNKNKILFVLRTSKTHWTDSQPQLIKIASRKKGLKQEETDKLCPFTALKQYLKVRGPETSVNQQFFIFADGSPVKPYHMRETLKLLLIQAGFEPRLYGTHRLRIGRASDLRKMNLSVETIKKLGRLASNSVFLYLK